jgi:very-short-patch-repair endonuclease
VTSELDELFAAQAGAATSAQIHQHISRGTMQRYLRRGRLYRVWPNVYSNNPPDIGTRLNGLDLRCGEPVAICLSTAAARYGFDTEGGRNLHVLNPLGHQLRNCSGLTVHRRDGVPLTDAGGRCASTPAWTAVEVARELRRPRALATLDAALRSGTCERQDLVDASLLQAGRRGIVSVRELIPLARWQAESAMESEARLAMLDGGLPEPVLQYEIIDFDGRLWRVDFAWPDDMVAVEYDGFDWHSSPEHLRRDRQKRAALQEMGWRLMSIVGDDVRHRPTPMVRQISGLLARRAA